MEINKTIIDKIKSIVKKYLNGRYSEDDFHAELNSLIPSITESELLDIREFLETIEGELEMIDFLSEQKNRPKDYRFVVEKIEIFCRDIVD